MKVVSGENRASTAADIPALSQPELDRQAGMIVRIGRKRRRSHSRRQAGGAYRELIFAGGDFFGRTGPGRMIALLRQFRRVNFRGVRRRMGALRQPSALHSREVVEAR